MQGQGSMFGNIPLGNFMGGLGDLYGAYQLSQQNFQNPANSAMPYLNQIPGTVTPYFQPYINAGQNAMSTLQGQYGNLLNNPGAMLNNIGSSFQQSPGFNFQVNQATNAANRAAAAGGMLGSPMEQQNLATTVNGLANQDYYNWLGNAMGMYGQGLSGMQGINELGYGASNNLAEMLAQNLSNQANLSYAGTANQNQYNQGNTMGMAGLISGGLQGIGSAAAPFLSALF